MKDTVQTVTTLTRGAIVLLLSTLAAGCDLSSIPEGDLPGDCRDAADNDLDGRTDCDDSGCAAEPECTDGEDTDNDTDPDTDDDTDPDTDDDTDPDTDDDTGSGRDPIDPAPHACFEVPKGRCPADTPMMGRSGDQMVQFANLTWTYDSRCGVSSAGPIYVRRPADLHSFALTVDGGARPTGIGFLAIDGYAELDVEASSAPIAWGTAPFKHNWAIAGSVVMPNSPATRPPVGDCVGIVPLASGDARGEDAQLLVSSRRESRGKTLDLNFIVVGGTSISGDDLSGALASTRDHFANADITLGDVYRWDISTGWGAYLPGIRSAETRSLRAVELEDAEDHAINVFFVQDVRGASVYGFAGGVPGPVGVPGTPASGVIISVDSHLYSDFRTLNTELMGSTIAHEVGHQLGLFHLSEATGTDHDVLSDTPRCTASRDFNGDGAVAPSECVGYGADHVMFWTASGSAQEDWSGQQADVLQRSPAVRP